MKKEIVIKRVYYLASNMDYVFMPIKIPCWLLDNWFTRQLDGYYLINPITDKSKGLILDRLGSNRGNMRKELLLMKAVRVSSNKTITLNTAKYLIEHSVTLTSPRYAPILVRDMSCIKESKTFRVILDTDLTIKGIDPSVDEIFTKLIQDEEKL